MEFRVSDKPSLETGLSEFFANEFKSEKWEVFTEHYISSYRVSKKEHFYIFPDENKIYFKLLFY
ncbi:MAG: hypothetical protein ACRC37_05880 [Lentisphaeria bacterium]